jgi:hypothetical protein
MPLPIKHLVKKKVDYTTRIHLKRKAQSIDFKFLAALAGLAAAVAVVVRAI